MNTEAYCAEPATESNPRGAQHAPRAATGFGASGQDPIASFDPETGKLRWGSEVPTGMRSTGTLAPSTLGKESWKWLFLQPLTTPQD